MCYTNSLHPTKNTLSCGEVSQQTSPLSHSHTQHIDCATLKPPVCVCVWCKQFVGWKACRLEHSMAGKLWLHTSVISLSFYMRGLPQLLHSETPQQPLITPSPPHHLSTLTHCSNGCVFDRVDICCTARHIYYRFGLLRRESFASCHKDKVLHLIQIDYLIFIRHNRILSSLD